MTVAELITTLSALPQDAPVALRTILPNQRVRWDNIDRVELRAPDQIPPVVLIGSEPGCSSVIYGYAAPALR
jgi:hypothetical protein